MTVVDAKGSVPREIGARMIVAPDGSFHGTIGGGTLEWQALAAAQAGVASSMAPVRRDYPLGPKLGQCCGGHVTLAYQRFSNADEAASWADAEGAGGITLTFAGDCVNAQRGVAISAAPAMGGVIQQRFGDDRTSLVLFGSGHVGRALVLALAPLPFRITWVDQRAEAFPAHTPENTTLISVQKPDEWCEQGLVDAGEECFVVIMTHSHTLDLGLADAALRHPAPAYVGLIGSKTKRARFTSRLLGAGVSESAVAALHCPIGLPALKDKRPASIAASVAVDLCIRREALEGVAAAPTSLQRVG